MWADITIPEDALSFNYLALRFPKKKKPRALFSPCSILKGYIFSRAFVSAAASLQEIWFFLPQIYVASWKPLQSGHVQDGELVARQTKPLQTSELLQDGGDAAKTVEGQAEVGQALQRAEIHGQRAQEVTVQEKSLQAECTYLLID